MNTGCYHVSSRVSAWKLTKPYFYAKWWPEGRGINETGQGFFNSPRGARAFGEGGIELESLFLVTLTPTTIRAREAAVQDSENSVYKMHEKDSEDSVYKMHEGWEREEGRGKRGGGHGQLAAGSRMASHPLHRQAYGGQASPLSIGWRKGQEGLRVGQW